MHRNPLSNKTPITHSEITSKLDGRCLGEMLKIWKDAACSVARINSLDSLNKKKIGLREVEQFSLGLRYNFKSEKLQRGSTRPVEGVVEAAMKVKVRDERENKRELERRKDELRKELAKVPPQ